ncbi:MFS transporter [Paraburkholderia sp. GAS32]|uniref:MFS transporter n=1 Tax=Paraburkholderia sp. GAS32 TaxID=3035129 RepID=UPI003D24B112
MASALFMDLLDTSALGAALPTLARQFHTSPLQLKFALTAYLMTMAVFVPASGWLADRYGARRVFVNAVKIYLLGSLCCGLSDSVSMLVASRVLQGVGGAMMTPVARLIVVATTPRARLVHAMNAFTMPAVVGPLLGPPLAGLLLEVASWRWIFFINLPVGILGIFTVLRVVPRLRHVHPGRFDLTGFLLAAFTIMTVVGLSETVGTGLLSTGEQLAIFACAAAGGVMFVLHALRSKAPMLDLRMLSKGTYRASMLGGSLMRVSISATPFLFPLLFQIGLGWSPVRSGFVMTGVMLGSILARFGGTFTIQRIGFRRALLATAVLTAIATMMPVAFRDSTPAIFIVATLVAGGFFRAAHFVAASALAFAEVLPAEVSKASTLSTVIQQISMGFGISLAGLTLYLSAGESQRLTVSDFTLSFVALGIVTLLSVPVYLALDRNAGANMRDHS